MGNALKHLLEFGPFRVDPEQRLLLRDQQPVPLSPKAFELLLALLQRNGEVVLKDDLMKLLWPDTFVEESNLGQHVFQIRKALGEKAQSSSYIVTVPGRGYRFAQKVRSVPEEADLVVESHSRSRIVIEELALPRREPPSPPKNRRMRFIVPAVIIAAVAVALALRPVVPAPKITRIRQLTHVGTVIWNGHLTTDGPRVYFRAWEGQNRILGYVSIEGGDVVQMEKAFPGIDIDDISPNGSEFLALDLDDPPSPSSDTQRLWRVPVAPGSPRPVGGLLVSDSRWSPDGSTIVYKDPSGLYLVDADGKNSRKVPGVPDGARHPQWSPDGKNLRFAVPDERGRNLALWQTNLTDGTAKPVLPKWPGTISVWPGRWTLDGRYFFFSALEGAGRDIWAIREPGGTLRRVDPNPVRLTAGPMNFYQPTPSRDGKSIFVVGTQVRGQLSRYDASSRQYVPYAPGISADHATFSPDGKWMAYVSNPEGFLVRSRLDGSERRQLTFSPMRALHPQWSPDGTQLAFQASPTLGAPNKIYLVSKVGGVPV